MRFKQKEMQTTLQAWIHYFLGFPRRNMPTWKHFSPFHLEFENRVECMIYGAVLDAYMMYHADVSLSMERNSGSWTFSSTTCLKNWNCISIFLLYLYNRHRPLSDASPSKRRTSCHPHSRCARPHLCHSHAEKLRKVPFGANKIQFSSSRSWTTLKPKRRFRLPTPSRRKCHRNHRRTPVCRWLFPPIPSSFYFCPFWLPWDAQWAWRLLLPWPER